MALKKPPAEEQVAAQIFQATEHLRMGREQQTLLEEVARMSGNETAAAMLD